MDWKRAFVINDDLKCGPAFIDAVKKGRGYAINACNCGALTRDREVFEHAQVFVRHTRLDVSLICSWVSVPRLNTYTKYFYNDKVKDQQLLHGGSNNDEDYCHQRLNSSDFDGQGAASDPESDKGGSLIKMVLETFLYNLCTSLTAYQRCADWFTMRQFRVISTNAGYILLSSDIFQGLAGVSASVPDLQP